MNDGTNAFSLGERIALGVSIAIIAASIVYWIVQIQGVRAMLRLAYG